MSNRTHDMFELAQRAGIETPETLSVALDRARVVGVLDAFADRTGIEPAVYRSEAHPGMWCCDCDGFSDASDGSKVFYGVTRDAARAAAAKAIETGKIA